MKNDYNFDNNIERYDDVINNYDNIGDEIDYEYVNYDNRKYERISYKELNINESKTTDKHKYTEILD